MKVGLARGHNPNLVPIWLKAKSAVAALGMVRQQSTQAVLHECSQAREHPQGYKTCLSEVGFEPTPTYVDQNLSLAP